MTFNLKKEWFLKIKNQEKTHEYRLCTPYWDKRIETLKRNLEGKIFGKLDYSKSKSMYKQIVFFKLGYPKRRDKKRTLAAVVKSITKRNGKNTDLKVNTDVYDIEFELLTNWKQLKEQENE